MKLLDSHWNDKYLGFTPGIKYSYKVKNKKENNKYMFESYIGISKPFYLNLDENDWAENFLTLTLGVRIGINKML
ncbi:MAG: hypothetical protein KAT68_08105 [Bacteroidales bacterium]|nr:hypothetical protein [Bacteroidales bacterium]